MLYCAGFLYLCIVDKFTKYLLLLVACVLALSGLQRGNRVEVFCSASQAVAAEQAPASFSAGETVKFPSLTRAEEQVSLFHHLPGPFYKNQSGGLFTQFLCSELHIQGAIAQYISRSANFCRSLSGSDIIFPFHYFW